MFLFSYLKDSQLINHVIAEHQVNSVIDCAHRCMHKSSCVSFNFEDHSTSPGHVCQINDEKKQNSFENFVGLDGFSYFEFEVSHRGVKLFTPFKIRCPRAIMLLMVFYSVREYFIASVKMLPFPLL